MGVIKLQYFKPSGKWGYEGVLEWPDHVSMHGLMGHIDYMIASNKLPGLSSGHWEGPIYVDSSDHPMGYPILMQGY
jgi:hypothetical protein